MTTITLPEYLERINQLINDNQISEAITHCRKILETYPRHIDTYRMMAKALLEQHDYDGAMDLFQRVLCADPNDFIAHVGLSVIRNEESQVEESLWHLERAFEIEPYNPAIQDELRRHYAQFSDESVDRIPLTSGALARLYIKGELYQQAVQELRQIIASESERVDLEVLLAEALWRNEQRIDAEEVCLNVLQKLPNCIMANAILSEVWLQTGRIGDSQKYLLRLQDLMCLDEMRLNLDTAVGQAFYTDGAPALPEKIELEFQGDFTLTEDASAATGKGPSAEWMSEVTFDSDMSQPFEYDQAAPPVVEESPSGMHNYDWMADIHEEESVPGADFVASEADWFVDPEMEPEPEADWLAEASGEAEDDAAVMADFDALFADDNDVPGFEAEPEAESDADWFVEQASAELSEEESFPSEHAVPGWLSELVDEPDVESIGEDLEEPAMGSDWFGEMESEAGPELGAAAEENVPDWLSDLVEEPPAEEEASFELASDPPADFDFLPPETSELQAPASAAKGETDWFIDPSAEDSWDEGEYTPEDVPDWLKEAEEDETSAMAADATVSDEADVTEPEEDGESVEVSDQEVPEWLAMHASELEETVVTDAEPAELDEWLADLSEDEAVTAEDEGAPVEEAVVASGMLGLAAAMAAKEDGEPEPDDDNEAEPAPEADDDWLVALAEESTPQVSEDVEADDTAVSLEDLMHTPQDLLSDSGELDSDWLVAPEPDEGEAVSAESLSAPFDEASDTLAMDDEERFPEWLLENIVGEPDEAEAVVSGDKEEKQPEEPGLPESEFGADDFEAGDDDWLSELTGDEPEEEGVPDWLSGYTEEGETESAAAEEPDLPGGGLTAWLSDLPEDEETGEDDLAAIEAEEEGVPDWLAGYADDEQAADEAEPAEELDLPSGGLTAWLSDGDAEEILGQDEPAPAGEPALPGGGLTAWLSEEGMDLEDEEPADAAPVAGMTDNELVDDIPPIPSEELFATDHENLPDWLSDASEGIPDLAGEEANLPDWLREGEGQDEDIPQALDSEDLLDFPADEEVPSLEIEADDLAEEDDLTVAGLTALLGSVDDDDMSTLEELNLGDEEDWLGQIEETKASTDPGLFGDSEEGVDLDWLTMPESDLVAAEETAVEEEVPPAEEFEPEMVDSDATVESMDDAMSWLEELAAQQETPVEEMPTVADDLLSADLAALEPEPETELEAEAPLAEATEAAAVEADDLAAAIAAEVEQETELEVETEDEESWLDVLMEEEEPADLEQPPEDLDEAMTWLEGLAAKQGADPEELPSLQDQSQADGFVAEAEGDLQEAMAWLEEMGQEEAPPPVTTSTPEDFGMDEEDELTLELTLALDRLDAQVKAEGIKAETVSAEPVSEEELTAALDWLEAVQTAEMDTVVSPPPVAEPAEAGETLETEDLLEMPDDPDEAIAWLEGMAAGDEDIAFDMEPPPISPSEDAQFVVDYGREDETVVAEEEAEAALAATAIEEPEPAPEVPATEDDIADMDLLEMPDDPDEAMAWLESLAAGDEEIAFDMEPPPITPSEDARFEVDYGAAAEPIAEADDRDIVDLIQGLTDFDPDVTLEADVADSAAAEEELFGADFDEDEDEGDDDLTWLEVMTDSDEAIDFDMEPPPITPSEDAQFVVDYGDAPEADTAVAEPEPTAEPDLIAPESSVDQLAAELEEEPIEDIESLDEMDVEDWLEDMLEGGDIDFDMEPPPITPSEDAQFVVDYGDRQEPETESATAVEESATADYLDSGIPEDPDEAVAWLDKIASEQAPYLDDAVGEPPADEAPLPTWMQAEEAVESAPADADQEAESSLDIIENLGVDIGEDLSDSLPDWFSMDAQSSASPDQSDWLGDFEEIDVSSWLAAEEEVTGSTIDEDMMLPDTGDISFPTPSVTETLSTLARLDSDLPEESPEVKTDDTAPIDESDLAVARSAMAAENYEDALSHYQQIIASGGGNITLIAELESLADQNPDKPAFRRLLGDAYMRNGQLQKALNTYREALDRL